MYRKILKNNHKSKRMNGYSNGKIGELLGIQDKNGEWLLVGDKVRYGKYIGRILYNHNSNRYELMLTYSRCGTDEFDVKSYGKSIRVPIDNGGRMELALLERQLKM